MFDPLPSFKGEVSKVETQKSFSQNLGVDRSNSSLIHQWVISGEAGCAGLCGGVNSNEGCYCDSSCTYYGDCCSNYQEECVEDGNRYFLVLLLNCKKLSHRPPQPCSKRKKRWGSQK